MQPEARVPRPKAPAERVGAPGPSLFPLSISVRLTISFLAVAVLAATANLIARESVSVILWNTPTTTQQSSNQAPVLLAGQTRRIVELESAINGFGHSVQSRIETSSPTIAMEYAAAEDNLRRAASGFLGSADAKSKAPSIADFIGAAKQLVAVADQRRVVRATHSKLARAMSARLQTTIDSAWKIFDRVIAPQSLMDLRAQLDIVQRNSERLIDGELVDANEYAALLASQDAFSASLSANGKKLAKSAGPDWVARMSADFNELVELNSKLATLNNQYNTLARRFFDNHRLLLAALTAALGAPNSQYAIAQTAPTGHAPASSPLPLDDVIAQTAVRHLDHRSRNLMAAVTAVVMLLVIAISIVAVRSIVTPVRRIIEASSQLALGKTRVQVARGGIRELDTLAGAFNDMADKLAAAHDASRDQQNTLEEKVRQRTRKLQVIAQQDPLTSLPNRRHLSVLLNDAIARATLERKYVGVYFLDVDNFKNFNDSLGHVFGDRVLMSVGNRLEELADGLGFVARLGGDEFTFVLERAESVEAIHDMGLRLVQAFQKMLAVDDRDLSISVSVGASIFPDHERDAEGLLRAADSALFHAKELGRSRLAVFTPELAESAAVRFRIEQGLRVALERGEFELVYQPEVNLATLEIGLVEALLRWRMPDGRIARPGEFLGVAEQSGLMSEISKWVLRTAVEDAAHWHHGGWKRSCVAINISPRQLLDPRFTDSLLGLLDEFDLPPGAIELELTETVFQTGAATIAALRALRMQGFGIALDDFGTGYSSLASLEKLPLSRIKLDQSLIASIDSSPRSAAIARAIIDLCSGLGLEVTAEGVERPAQLAWLLRNPTMSVQGYLLSDALPFADVLQCRAHLVPKMHNLLLSIQIDKSARTAPEDETKNFASG
jgi:diguanylate cyclase (GGDEF)-like protein